MQSGDVRWRLDELDRMHANDGGNGAAADAQPPAARRRRRLREVRRTARVFGHTLCRLWCRSPGADDWLAKAMRRFTPQPYLQLAKTVRAAGYEAAANDILVRLERNRTCYGGYGAWRQVGRWSLDWALRYGFAPLRPITIMLVWAAVSAVWFELAYAHRDIIPTKENQESYNPAAPRPSDCAQASERCPRVAFNAVTFAVESLVPLIDLDQKKNWIVEPISHRVEADAANAMSGPAKLALETLHELPDSLTAWLIVFNTFFGWLMTTFAAAGITGLLRNGKDFG